MRHHSVGVSRRRIDHRLVLGIDSGRCTPAGGVMRRTLRDRGAHRGTGPSRGLRPGRPAPAGPAEIARTLVRGRLPGLLRVAGRPRPLAVQHATDCAGRPMVLARVGSDVSRALGAVDGRSPVAAMLSIDDRPPVDGAPKLGRAHVGGWIHRVAGDERYLARLEFAEAKTVEDRLDVGAGVTIYLIDLPATAGVPRKSGIAANSLVRYAIGGTPPEYYTPCYFLGVLDIVRTVLLATNGK